jgi:hypothetical protein
MLLFASSLKGLKLVKCNVLSGTSDPGIHNIIMVGMLSSTAGHGISVGLSAI